MTFEDIVAAVHAERQRQDAKWGRDFPGRSDSFWLTILAEEFGEVANAILEHEENHTVEELIQVAAVVFSWLEFRTPSDEQWPDSGERGER
jgi:NTP pyrophosphatase (non-canonical NTP hydrolase)